MAITKNVTSQITSQREQTWRTNLETPAEGTRSVQIFRELVGLDAEGNQVGQPQQSYMPINRLFDSVAEETITFDDGTEIAFQDIVEALSAFGDKWAQEDLENPPGQPPAPPPPEPPPT